MPTEAKNEKKRVEDDQDRGVVRHSGGGELMIGAGGQNLAASNFTQERSSILQSVTIEIRWQSLFF
jgi:hypothetical protein